MAKLVYNIQPASPTMISSLARHCSHRTPDGSSNIDKKRSKLNRVIVGEPIEMIENEPTGGLSKSLEKFFAGGVQRPTKQAEKPFLRIVVSASPEYFRPNNPAAVGTWDDDRLEKWLGASTTQLKEEHGADLVHVELHLDEDTPHLHAVVAPTYFKKARVPGKQKRGETPEQFEERKKQARASEGVRTVGRASHASLSQKDSFKKLRERMTIALDHLGIEYGEDRSINAPEGQSTREYVKQLADDLRKREANLIDKEAAIKKREEHLKAREESDAEDQQRFWDILNVAQEGMEHIQNGTYNDELTLDHLPDNAKKHFEKICDFGKDYGDRDAAILGDLIFHKMLCGSSGKMDRNVSGWVEAAAYALSEGLDKIANWMDGMRQKATNVLTEAQKAATEAAKGIQATAETQATQILSDARERANEYAGEDIRIRGYSTMLDLMREKTKLVHGEDGFQKVAVEVSKVWDTHDHNLDRPMPKVSYPSYER